MQTERLACVPNMKVGGFPMQYDYNLVKSRTPEEFKALTSNKGNVKFNVADDEEIKKMERLLDLLPGTLVPAGPYHLEAVQCASCGRTLTTYDCIFTALVDANHTKS